MSGRDTSWYESWAAEQTAVARLYHDEGDEAVTNEASISVSALKLALSRARAKSATLPNIRLIVVLDDLGLDFRGTLSSPTAQFRVDHIISWTQIFYAHDAVLLSLYDKAADTVINKLQAASNAP